MEKHRTLIADCLDIPLQLGIRSQLLCKVGCVHELSLTTNEIIETKCSKSEDYWKINQNQN